MQKPRRLVYVQSLSDENEGTTAHPANPTFPKELLTMINFEAIGSKTKMTFSYVVTNTSEEEVVTFEKAKSSMNQG